MQIIDYTVVPNYKVFIFCYSRHWCLISFQSSNKVAHNRLCYKLEREVEKVMRPDLFLWDLVLKVHKLYIKNKCIA